MPEAPENDALSRVIPYKNPPALAGYYCAVFGLIIPLLGLVGLVLGAFGIKKSLTEPGVKGAAHAYIGIILGGLAGFGWLSLLIWL